MGGLGCYVLLRFVVPKMKAKRKLLRTNLASIVLDFGGAGGTTFPLPSRPSDITR